MEKPRGRARYYIGCHVGVLNFKHAQHVQEIQHQNHDSITKLNSKGKYIIGLRDKYNTFVDA